MALTGRDVPVHLLAQFDRDKEAVGRRGEHAIAGDLCRVGWGSHRCLTGSAAVDHHALDLRSQITKVHVQLEGGEEAEGRAYRVLVVPGCVV